MEFQGIITNKDGSPMGAFASVQAELTRMFPDLVFEWSSTGIQKLADLDSRGIELPSLIRRSLEAQASFLCGSMGCGPMSVSFNIGSSEPVGCIWVTVNGEDQVAEPALALIRSKPGWIVESPEPLRVVKLAPNEELHLTGGATLVFEDSQSTKAPPAGIQGVS